jgi:glycosyltransferase involved in cell wall biosynthesis
VKLAIIGTRGIPAGYGGFETFAEECGAGLAARGHDVTVYCRSHYVRPARERYRGVRLVVLPTLRFKHTDTVVHALLSTLHSLGGGYDAVLMCNAANAIFSAVPRLAGVPVALNVDGIERHRKKWSWPARAYYRLSERLATLLPNVIVTDARVIERYYAEEYGAGSVFISYGASADRPPAGATLAGLGVASGEYFLYVSRLEPENNAHRVVAAFEKVRTQKKLLVVGDAPYARGYIAQLRSTPDARIVFPGAIYGLGYRELQAHAFCYVHATEVGGTHPALVEAMGVGGLVVCNDTPENREALGDAGLYSRIEDTAALAALLQDIEDAPDRYAHLRGAALERARACYSWEAVVDRYEKLLRGLAAGG